MNTSNAIRFYDERAIEFAHKYSASASFRERYQLWTSLFERYIKPSASVMDLGCGPGIFSRHLADRGCWVTGVDGSAAMIALCRQTRQRANAQYIQQSLPLANLYGFEPQDVLLMSSVLEYVDDMAEMLGQARDLLKPAGLLIVSMPNRASIYRIAERILFTLTTWPSYLAHSRHLITEAAFYQPLNQLGFDQLEVAYFSGKDPVSRLLKPFLANCYVNNLFVGVYQKRAC